MFTVGHFKETLKTNSWVRDILSQAKFYLAKDGKSSYFKTDPEIAIKLNRLDEFLKVQDDAVILLGIRPLFLQEVLLDRDLKHIMYRMISLGQEYGNGITHDHSGNIYKRYINNVEVKIKSYGFCLIFADSLVQLDYLRSSLVESAVKHNCRSVENMIDDLHVYLSKEALVEKQRSKNKALIDQINLLISKANYKLNLETSLAGVEIYQDIKDNKLSVDKAHYIRFNSQDYEIDRQMLGMLAINLYTELKSKGCDLSDFN